MTTPVLLESVDVVEISRQVSDSKRKVDAT